MRSGVIQNWPFGYLCCAVVVTGCAALAADLLKAGDPPSSRALYGAAVLAGALWPMTIVGLAQFWTISQFVGRVSPSRAAGAASPLLPAGGSH